MADRATSFSPLSRVWHGVVLAAVLGLGLSSPYWIFGVSPWPTGNRGQEAPAGVTSHTPAAPVMVMPADALEAQVRQDVYKWCGFCHTMTPNGDHLLGPNLHGIIGQTAGTVPNFPNYSDAMVQARANGLVWTDETLDAFIADPQAFLPGTNMVVSIGAIPDPAVRARIINLLKRDTMGAMARESGAAATPTQPEDRP